MLSLCSILTKTDLKPVALSLVMTGFLTTLLQSQAAQAASLNWQTVKTGNPTFFNSSGVFKSASNTVSVTNGGTVNLTFGTIANINATSPVRAQGLTSQFVSSTPRIDATLNGTLPNTSPSLYLQQDASSVNNAIYAGLKFNNTGGVSGLTFTLFDIDNSSNSLVSNVWQDRVIVRGLLNGVAVLPTSVTAVSSYVSASSGNISINGGANRSTPYAGGNVTGVTVLDGTKSVNNDSSNNGNVTFSFSSKIDELYIDFTQAPGAFSNSATANPSSHGIGIGDMTYAVPEPFTLLGSGAAIGFGAIFKRRLAKARSQKKA
ncbi:MAG: PEP-CTERM sorting domain-containing protein [Snowella sp.]|nr:PEP-CTERM sorting domain-containing protein [Snowella sp.]